VPFFIFITETFMLQFVVRKLGALGHISVADMGKDIKR
jgi:hypothetical protein